MVGIDSIDSTIELCQYRLVIVTFKCRDTEALFKGKRVKKFMRIEAAAMRKLAMLNVAGKMNDIAFPPGNRLEALRGDRAGQWSIRINDQWMICFRFENGSVQDVEIVDYH